jgi:ribosomal protein S8
MNNEPRATSTKEEAQQRKRIGQQVLAKKIISQVLEFMQDNDYIDSIYNGTPDISSEDIEQLQDIAYGNIEVYVKNRSSNTL